MKTKVGSSVLVNFKVEDGKTTKGRPTVYKITHEYLNSSKVKTSNGDVFIVTPHEGNLDGVNYQFLAVE